MCERERSCCPKPADMRCCVTRVAAITRRVLPLLALFSLASLCLRVGFFGWLLFSSMVPLGTKFKFDDAPALRRSRPSTFGSAFLAVLPVDAAGHHDPEHRTTNAHHRRLGASPATVERLISWAQQREIRWHPRVAFVQSSSSASSDLGGDDAADEDDARRPPWTWTAVAVASDRPLPPVTATLADVQREAELANDGLPVSQRPVVIPGGSGVIEVPFDAMISAASEAQLISKLERRFDSLEPPPTGEDDEEGSHNNPADDDDPAGFRAFSSSADNAYRLNRNPFTEVLKTTHYTTFYSLSWTEAARCLGPRFYRKYAAKFTTGAAEGSRGSAAGGIQPQMYQPPLATPVLAYITRGFAFRDPPMEAMIPLVDLINHNSHEANTRVGPNPKRKIGLVWSVADIHDGEEITWQYHRTLTPLVAVSNYGFFDAKEITMVTLSLIEEMGGGGISTAIGRAIDARVKDPAVAQQCRDVENALSFDLSGFPIGGTLICAEIFFNHAEEAMTEASDEALSQAKEPPPADGGAVSVNVLRAMIQLARKQRDQWYPIRYENRAAIPLDWTLLPHLNESFVPTRSWVDCLDEESTARVHPHDRRRETLEAVFAAEEFMRVALGKIVSRCEEELDRLITVTE